MRTRRRGSVLLEAVMFAPLLVLLLTGMVEMARMTYTYYALHKTLYNLARALSAQQAANFCDSSDVNLAAVKNYALTGSTDGSADPLLPGLTPDRIQIRIERYNASTQTLDVCGCDATGCDTAAGGLAPDYVVVSIIDGYEFRPRIFRLTLNPILFRPRVRAPYGGA